ncbi:hypothetical protein Q8F77_26960, partial [Klebsiella pneumoniae]|nr:hypothetical protein [Klebsiella pneumoniae]
MLTYQRCMLTAGFFPLTAFCQKGAITKPELAVRENAGAGRELALLHNSQPPRAAPHPRTGLLLKKKIVYTAPSSAESGVTVI